MNKQVISFVVLIFVLFCIVIVQKVKIAEFFTNSGPASEIECPVSAIRTPEGKIKVDGKHIFSSMKDYVAWLSGKYASGSKCIPPMVENKREPIDGILGGLGVGAPSATDIDKQGATREVLNTNTSDELTSAKTPIRKLDDYEYTRVYETERNGKNTISVEGKNKLMSERILDWASMPFNSDKFAEKSNEFVAARMDNIWVEPKSGVYFRNMRGDDVLPPDVEAEKERERQVLAEYRPTDVTKHIIDSKTEQVAKLVNKMYENDPDWIPIVEKQSDNNYAITELIPKPRKERYEDAEAQKLGLKDVARNGDIQPKPTIDILNRLEDDPYFTKTGVADMTNDRFWNYNDFRKWTPGLERMFAPTSETKNWY